MNFKLSTSSYFYKNNSHKARLEELWFMFEPYDFLDYQFRIVRDENPTINIDNLEDLIKFVNDFWEWEVVLTPTSIEIYDGYRE